MSAVPGSAVVATLSSAPLGEGRTGMTVGLVRADGSGKRREIAFIGGFSQLACEAIAGALDCRLQLLGAHLLVTIAAVDRMHQLG